LQKNLYPAPSRYPRSRISTYFHYSRQQQEKKKLNTANAHAIVTVPPPVQVHERATLAKEALSCTFFRSPAPRQKWKKEKFNTHSVSLLLVITFTFHYYIIFIKQKQNDFLQEIAIFNLECVRPHISLRLLAFQRFVSDR
jgi:hypothetical protein